ncbi:MAG: hypothetical protein LIO94_05400 [Clostridiales bacterium]|nr:hypothetical protein [Clostridiales bacterium]
MYNGFMKELSLSGAKVQYDTQCKRVLAHKSILAWILKYTLEEFFEVSLEDIPGYIEGGIDIGTVPVYPGETNAERIIGLPNEDKVNGEGEVRFDIRFSVRLPDPNAYEPAFMLINAEAQKDFYPGYQIVTRGVFYGARMISAQLETVFTHSDYDKIQKVSSIWICMNAPQKYGNRIASYSIGQFDLYGVLPMRRQAYDKLNVVIITLNETVETDNVLLQLLNIILSVNLSYEEKRKLLEEKYFIPIQEEFGKELNLMCNLSDLIEEKGIQKGISQGISQGIDSMAELVKKLLMEGRTEDALKASTDPLYRDLLFQQLNAENELR